MIKYALASLILILSVRLSTTYVRKKEKDLDLFRELCDFVAFLDGRMRLSIAPVSVLIKGFKSKQLSEIGFTDAVLGGESLESAFLKHVEKDAISDKGYGIFVDLFSKFGGGSVDFERKRLSILSSSLCSEFEIEKEKFKKQGVVVKTLSFSLALGIIILLL